MNCPACNLPNSYLDNISYISIQCKNCNTQSHHNLQRELIAVYYKFPDYEVDVYIKYNMTAIYKLTELPISSQLQKLSLVHKFNYQFPITDAPSLYNKIITLLPFI